MYSKVISIYSGDIHQYNDYSTRRNPYFIDTSIAEISLNEAFKDIAEEGGVVVNVLANSICQGNNPPSHFQVYTILYTKAL